MNCNAKKQINAGCECSTLLVRLLWLWEGGESLLVTGGCFGIEADVLIVCGFIQGDEQMLPG